jgi:exodeoxyribonuclease V alpha subunit
VKDVYNGDIGKIINYDNEKRAVIVNFDERLVKYDVSELDELNLAYSVTVHKSQGSEYPVIIMPIVQQHRIMLQRNLLYTAISRGKQLVILLGVENAVSMAVNNKKAKTRYTYLRPRLQEKFYQEGE